MKKFIYIVTILFKNGETKEEKMIVNKRPLSKNEIKNITTLTKRNKEIKQLTFAIKDVIEDLSVEALLSYRI